MIGDYSKGLKTLFEELQHTFSENYHSDRKIHTTGGIMLHDLSCHAYRNRDTAGHYEFLRTFVLALAVMLLAYCVLVFMIARLNPIILLKKHASAMMASFSLASSNAAMPFNINHAIDWESLPGYLRFPYR